MIAKDNEKNRCVDTNNDQVGCSTEDDGKVFLSSSMENLLDELLIEIKKDVSDLEKAEQDASLPGEKKTDTILNEPLTNSHS